MVLDLGSIFAKKATRKEPLLNIGFINTSSGDLTGRNYFRAHSFRRVWKWFMTRPELYSVVSIPVNDTVGGEIEFTDVNDKKLGRNKLLEAKRMFKENNIREVMKAIDFDRYMTGNAYGFKGYLNSGQKSKIKYNIQKEARRIANERYNFKTKMLGFKEEEFADYLFMKALVDEDLSRPRKFDYVASSTMDIKADATRVLGYTQRAMGNEVQFNTDEIVHFVYERVDGKIYGFSPVETMMAEMYLLQMIKDNMIAFFENGGHPSKVYSLPDVKTMSDPAYERLINMLSESKKVINSNGSLVYVGNLKVDDLGSSPKDLEYQNLAMWVTSIVAFALHIPSTRIPYLLSGKGGTVNKGDSGGISDAGYWRMIEAQQTYLEDVYNNQLFSEFGFHIHFKRQNTQEKIRTTQAMVQMLDGVGKLQALASTQGLKMKKEKFLKMIESTDDEFEEMSEDEMMMQQQPNIPNNRQNQLNKVQSLGEQDKIDRSNYKRATSS